MLKENTRSQLKNLRTAKKIFLWSLIAVYTYNLPNARVVYNFLVETIGQELTGKVPLVLVGVTGLTYAALLLISRRSLKNLLFLIPSGIIAYTIITLEPNPNKHIHIPQYVLMAWLLFEALSMEYRSADIYFLIFLAASMLGVVDELEQGIHPARFYGWSDMLVNSSSALIGIFTLMGLKATKRIDFGWAGGLWKRKGILAVVLFGAGCTILMAINLFKVQAAEQFWGVYPLWLLVCNLIFIILVIISIISLVITRKPDDKDTSIAIDDASAVHERIAKTWLLLLLSILMYMNLLLVYFVARGLEFR